METSHQQGEDLAQLLTRVMAERDMTQSELARRAGVHVSTVNLWVRRKRGSGRGPNRETLARVAEALSIPARDVFAAAGRKTPGPLSPDAEQRLLEFFRELTAEQQRMLETTARALAEENRVSDS